MGNTQRHGNTTSPPNTPLASYVPERRWYDEGYTFFV